MRSVRIARIDIVGLEQVSERRIDDVLRGEGLQVGSEVSLPRDGRVERIKSRLRGTGSNYRDNDTRLAPR